MMDNTDTVCELHFHTKETSRCGKVPAAEAIPLYKANGYDLVVVTDHYNFNYFEEHTAGTKSWQDTMEDWYLGYREAKRAGDECGVTVLHGVEMRFPENHNDYLVYGMTDELFFSEPTLYQMSLAEFSVFAKAHSLLVFQAHPFRNGQIPMDPEYLDGIEIFNSHPHHNARNHLAKKYAEDNGLIGICGQDFHELDAMLGCKSIFHGKIKTMDDLVAKLRARDFEVVPPEHPAVFDED